MSLILPAVLFCSVFNLHLRCAKRCLFWAVFLMWAAIWGPGVAEEGLCRWTEWQKRDASWVQSARFRVRDLSSGKITQIPGAMPSQSAPTWSQGKTVEQSALPKRFLQVTVLFRTGSARLGYDSN